MKYKEEFQYDILAWVETMGHEQKLCLPLTILVCINHPLPSFTVFLHPLANAVHSRPQIHKKKGNWVPE